MIISRAVVRLQRRRLRNRRRGFLRQRRRVLPTGPRHRGLHPAVRGGWGGVVKLCRWEFLGMGSGEERGGKLWFYAILRGFERSLRWFYGIVMGIKMGFDGNFMGFLREAHGIFVANEMEIVIYPPASMAIENPHGGRTWYRFGVTSLGSANIRRDERHNKFLERAPNPRPQYRHSKAAPDADVACVCITSVWVIQQELSWQPLPPRPSAARCPGHRQGYRVTPAARQRAIQAIQAIQSKAPLQHFRLRS